MNFDTLGKFCALENDPREWMRKPILADGMVVALNGHILVAVPSSNFEPADLDRCSFGGIPDGVAEGLRGHLRGAFDAAKDDGGTWRRADAIEIDREPCSRCNGRGMVNVEPCADCDGDGEFWHGEHTYGCKTCEESGEIVTAGDGARCWACVGTGVYQGHTDFNVEGSGQPYSANSIYVAQLRSLPNAELREQVTASGAIPVRFDGGVGALMPMRTNGQVFERTVVESTAGAPA